MSKDATRIYSTCFSVLSDGYCDLIGLARCWRFFCCDNEGTCCSAEFAADTEEWWLFPRECCDVVLERVFLRLTVKLLESLAAGKEVNDGCLREPVELEEVVVGRSGRTVAMLVFYSDARCEEVRYCRMSNFLKHIAVERAGTIPLQMIDSALVDCRWGVAASKTLC